MSSERKDNLLGVALRVTKANDIPPVPLKILVFKFSEDGLGLEHIGLGDDYLFPALSSDNKMGDFDKMLAFMGTEQWTPGEVSSQTGIPLSFVIDQILKSGYFKPTQIIANKRYYKVAEAGA